jgi:hypothetical protein
MNVDQKTVAIGAASGVACMFLLNAAVYAGFPTISGIDTVIDRLVFTLKLNVFAVIPLFIAVAIVGNGRFLSDANDPLRHVENRAMEINDCVVDNTLQHNFVLFIGTSLFRTS